MSTSTTLTTTHSSAATAVFRPSAAASCSSAASSSNIHTIHDKLPSSLPSAASAACAALPPPSLQPPFAVVSAASLAAHLGPQSGALSSSGACDLPAWTSINGHVYDMSAFMAHHPGGDVIQLAAGREASALIESYHGAGSMARVYAALQNKCQYVGELQGYQPPVGAQFFQAVQRRVDDFLKARRLHYHSFETWAVAEAALTLSLFLLATYFCCVRGSVLSAVLLGVLTARMGFLMHTGNHCASSSVSWVNGAIGLFMNVIGSSHLIWRHEHQVAHHLDPNELERDNDCTIGNPFIRMHPHLPPHAWQRWQHVTVPIAISFGFIKWYVTDFVHFVNGYVGSVRFAVSSEQWCVLLPAKLVWLAVRVLLPLYCFEPLHALLLIVLPLGIGAHYLENIFIVNHIQHGLVPPSAAHWSCKQVLGTSNWQSGSVWWNWVSGGLNHQIEHHLFPSMNIALYPLISPVVQQTCHDFGLPYHNYPSFATAYVDMIRYLRAMGDPTFTPDKFTSYLQKQQLMQQTAAARPATSKGVKVGRKGD